MNISMFETEDLIQELMKRGYIRVLWHKNDIEDEAERMGITLTENQIENVIGYLESNHDANNGVNWDVINYVIGTVI